MGIKRTGWRVSENTGAGEPPHLKQPRKQLAPHFRGILLPRGPEALHELPVLDAAPPVQRVHGEERAVAPDVDEDDEGGVRDAAVRHVPRGAELHELLPKEDEEHAGVRGMPHVRVRAPGDQGVVILDRDLVREERAEGAEGPQPEQRAGEHDGNADEESGGHVEERVESGRVRGTQHRCNGRDLVMGEQND